MKVCDRCGAECCSSMELKLIHVDNSGRQGVSVDTCNDCESVLVKGLEKLADDFRQMTVCRKDMPLPPPAAATLYPTPGELDEDVPF